MTSDPPRHVTELGCTLTLISAPEELGDGMLLHMRMDQEGDGRSHEVYLSPDDARWLTGELSPASWDALMHLLAKNWPEDIFPTAGPEDTGNLDHATPRDPGPMIVGLLRWVALLRAENDELRIGRRQARKDTADALSQLANARAALDGDVDAECRPKGSVAAEVHRLVGERNDHQASAPGAIDPKKEG